MFSRILFATFVFATISAQASCIHGTSFLRREVSEEGKVKVSNFGYNKENGPANWAQLEAGNTQCATGKNQSPILLDDTIPKATSRPKVVIADVEEAEFENLGTTLEVIANGTTTFEDKDFALKQFHLHTPSEHRINEEYFPVEMHMVHEGADGSIVVLAVPFQLTEDGSTTQLLTSVIENIDNVTTPGTVTKTGKLEFAELTKALETEALFQYTGSLTTPPCAEGLTFLVMEKPLPLDVKTFNSLKSVMKFNSRFVQNELGKPNVLEVASEAAAKVQCAGPGDKTEVKVDMKADHAGPGDKKTEAKVDMKAGDAGPGDKKTEAKVDMKADHAGPGDKKTEAKVDMKADHAGPGDKKTEAKVDMEAGHQRTSTMSASKTEETDSASQKMETEAKGSKSEETKMEENGKEAGSEQHKVMPAGNKMWRRRRSYKQQ
ncbi:hypothetical protein E1B28_002653 [Marasmius oreades]|uniref:Carbonic anhydrase n=1 Tax=Marasmius oreades TaxID=181124 RepID=A0A9P7UL05_9AGAR|nr:uncharacterized protein E1B28_002653 [Marasmius oreades]KAG7086717.1 hypothetical protein E1B28_002653 [Marasmius oreades]